MAKLKKNCKEQSEIELREMEKGKYSLIKEKKKWEDEKKELSEENKRLEYI
jgi:hypothetical protein